MGVTFAYMAMVHPEDKQWWLYRVVEIDGVDRHPSHEEPVARFSSRHEAVLFNAALARGKIDD